MRVGALTVDPVYDGYGAQIARLELSRPHRPQRTTETGGIDGVANAAPDPP
jgi:hypothetical protein